MTIGSGNRASKGTRHTARNVDAGPPVGMSLSLFLSYAPENQRQAVRFEQYLKSGSGRAFAKRHFSEMEKPDL